MNTAGDEVVHFYCPVHRKMIPHRPKQTTQHVEEAEIRLAETAFCLRAKCAETSCQKALKIHSVTLYGLQPKAFVALAEFPKQLNVICGDHSTDVTVADAALQVLRWNV